MQKSNKNEIFMARVKMSSTIMQQCQQRYTIKNFAGLSHTNLKFLPLV